MDMTEKTVRKTGVFDGRILKVYVDDVTLPDGKPADREYIRHAGGVCVLATTDTDEVLLVRQYRYVYGKVLSELPAGKRDHGNETPLDGAKRELKEETGAEAKTWTPLGELYPSPGYTDEVIYLFWAKNLTFGEQMPDEDEFLEVERVPFEKALDMVISGEIKDAKTQTALLKAAFIRERNKDK